jgi:lipoprotein-releasing system permease protein
MFNWFEIWMGTRYVRARSSNRFVSLISAISMLGIAIAVAVLIIVLSVVNGFERELKDRLLLMSAHATIEDPRKGLSAWQGRVADAVANPRVRAAAPFVDGQALIMFGEKLSGIQLRGIDPALEDEVSGVSEVITSGSLSSLADRGFGIVLGEELANVLRAGLGDKVSVVLAEGIVTPAGVMPRYKRFTVQGIYRVGMYEFDRRLAFIHIADAQRLYRKGETVSGIRLAVNEIYSAPAIVREVALDMGVAAFNIVSTLVMVVKDKQADIAILRTVGANPSTILKIFMTQGSIIGVVGTLAGVALGVTFTLNLETIVSFMESAFGIKFLAADVYFISDLPADLHMADVVKISAIALILALASTVYPAWRGARTMPAEALRYE